VGTAIAVAAALAHISLYLAPFEDAFITYRYAENLLAGHGLVYNPGEIVEGYSSFLWTIVLAGLKGLGVPIQLGSQFLSILAGLALVWLAVRLAHATRQAAAGAPVEPNTTDACAGLLVAAQGTFAYYSGTGMETTLFASVLATAGLVLLAPTPRRAWTAGLLLGVATTIRPEGMGYAALVVVALAVHAADRRDAMRVAAGILAVFLPHEVWRWLHFGFPLPNTYYAKASPSSGLLRAGLGHAEAFLIGHGFVLAAVAAALQVVRAPTRGARLAVAIVLGAIVNVIVVGGDTFAFFRFFLPALAFGAAAIAGVAGRLGPRAGAAGLVVLAGLLFATDFFPTHSFLTHEAASERARVHDVARIDADYLVVGRLLRATNKPASLLAINAAGIVPYVSGLRTIDMLGLTDAHIAHRDIDLGHGAIGHEKHDAAYVLERRPDLIVLGLPRLVRQGPLTQPRLRALLQRYLPYLPGDAEMLAQPGFARWYEPVGIPADEARMVLAFVRRDQPRPDGEPAPWIRR